MGLLDKFNRGMGALETGLLGNATAFNPQLAQYLSPGVMQSAQKDARMQLGLAMLAASESGMGFGQGMMMAQQMAGQAFQQPLQQDLQGNMQIRALEKIKEQQKAEEQMRAQLAAYRQANPDKANLPDEILMKYMDPSFGIQTAQLGLDQVQTAQNITNSDRNYEIQQQQLRQSAAAQAAAQKNADRQFQLQQLEAQREEQKFRAEIEKAGLPKVDEVEVRKRRESAIAANELSTLTGRLKDSVTRHGTEFLDPVVSGQQSSLREQIKSTYKTMYQLGTLDEGLNKLFEGLLADPQGVSMQFRPGGKQKLITQLDELSRTTGEAYKGHYDFLSSAGFANGLAPPITTAPAGTAQFLSQLEAELKRRGL
jgi:hypothetical protein